MIKFIEIIDKEEQNDGAEKNLFRIDQIKRVLMFDNVIRYYIEGRNGDGYIMEEYQTKEECLKRYAEVKKILCPK